MTKRTGRELKNWSVSRSKCQPTEQNKFSSEEFDHLFVNKTTSLSASKKYIKSSSWNPLNTSLDLNGSEVSSIKTEL